MAVAAAQSYADVAKGVPVCRICQNKRQPVWQNDQFSIYTAVKSAWPGHCFIVSRQHISASDFHRNSTLVEELYHRALPRLCDALAKILPVTSFDQVLTGHAHHMCLQVLPRRNVNDQGVYVNQFRCMYRDPQPLQALDMTVALPHTIDVETTLQDLLNPPLLVAAEPPSSNPAPFAFSAFSADSAPSAASTSAAAASCTIM